MVNVWICTWLLLPILPILYDFNNCMHMLGIAMMTSHTCCNLYII